jgi:hypothetical protein
VATDPLSNAWLSYRKAIESFREIAGPALGADSLLDDDRVVQADEALGAVVARSEELHDACRHLLAGRFARQYDELAVMLLAAAALDCMVADSGLRIDPEPILPDPEVPTGRLPELSEPFDLLLRDANALFERHLGDAPLGGGQEVNRAQLNTECIAAIDTLIHVASEPALRWGFNAVTMGAPLIGQVAVPSALNGLNQVIGQAKRVRGHAVRLLREGVRKLITVAGEQALESGLECLREELNATGTRQLGSVAGRDVGVAIVARGIARPATLSPSLVANVRLKISALTAAYTEQMRWTGRIAAWVGRLSPLISTLAAPAGLGVVLALDGIGLGFVVYTLAVRLDGRPFPSHVGGVGTILREGL